MVAPPEKRPTEHLLEILSTAVNRLRKFPQQSSESGLPPLAKQDHLVDEALDETGYIGRNRQAWKTTTPDSLTVRE